MRCSPTPTPALATPGECAVGMEYLREVSDGVYCMDLTHIVRAATNWDRYGVQYKCTVGGWAAVFCCPSKYRRAAAVRLGTRSKCLWTEVQDHHFFTTAQTSHSYRSVAFARQATPTTVSGGRCPPASRSMKSIQASAQPRSTTSSLSTSGSPVSLTM